MGSIAVKPPVTTFDASTSAPPTRRAGRIDSLDIVRGLVMVLMAIDHVRVYSGLPAGGPTAGIFFTRWVTHFCAPAFVFFAGTAAFLYGQKVGDRPTLARWLLTRGLLLVVLELTVIRFTWTFNLAYSEFVLAGVIWMLGWCMVMLAALVRFSPKSVGIAGVAIMLFQQVFYFVPRIFPASMRPAVGTVWEFFYPTGLDGTPGISVLYVLIPWIGVMMAGYGFGTIMLREPAERRKLCLRIGLGATALFVILASIVVVVQTPGDDAPPALFRALNQGKYPPTQLFLLMTLGPMIALLPVAERMRGWPATILATFGCVPLFYYLLHIPLIHVTALAVMMMREGTLHPEWYASAPFTQVPPEARWGLPLLYLVFAIDVFLLYFACRWYARYKAKKGTGWVTYI
jgi:uncharacterized membrane protein